MTTPIEGLHNFRDTGGTPLSAGGATRSGVLYRSDALGALTPAGLAELASTPIGVVVDFRTPEERQSAPDRLPDSRPIHVVELSILEGAMAQMAQTFLGAGSPASPELIAKALSSLPTLDELYIGMLQHGAPAFAEVARLVAASTDDAPTAVLVHCTAGKDRTGVATAVLLDAVGADRTSVVADYAASEANLAGAWADGVLQMISSLGMPLTPPLTTLVTGTPAAAIESALAWTDAGFGGAAGYLRSGGLTELELAALRTRLAG